MPSGWFGSDEKFDMYTSPRLATSLGLPFANSVLPPLQTHTIGIFNVYFPFHSAQPHSSSPFTCIGSEEMAALRDLFTKKPAAQVV